MIFVNGWQLPGICHSREDGRMVEHVRYPGAKACFDFSATLSFSFFFCQVVPSRCVASSARSLDGENHRAQLTSQGMVK